MLPFMHVLVIGGAGYIGSHVTYALLNSGHQVTVMDNLSSGLRGNLLPDAGFLHGDIRDSQWVEEQFSAAPYDAVVHLAALKAAGESMHEPERYSRSNICATINVVSAMARHGVKRLVFSSSAAVYGEPRYLPVDEAHPTEPTNFYGFTKLEIERILHWFDRLRGIRFAALRYFNAAGYEPDGAVSGLEQNPANLLPIIMEAAMGMREQVAVFGNDYETRDGTGLRDYVHVTDLADAHVRALRFINAHDRSLTLNLGSEAGITVQEMIDAARRITGKPIPAAVSARRAGDPAQLIASSARARELLEWEPRHSDVETLVRTSWAAYSR